MKISEFVRKKVQEDLENVPDVVREAAEALASFEETFGTEATVKLIEQTCMDELSKEGDDKGYVTFLIKIMADLRQELGKPTN